MQHGIQTAQKGKRGRLGQPRGLSPPLPHGSQPGCLPDVQGAVQEQELQGGID